MVNWFRFDSTQQVVYFQNQQIIQELGAGTLDAQIRIQNRTTGADQTYHYTLNREMREEQFRPRETMMSGVYVFTLRIAGYEKKCMFVLSPSAEGEKYLVRIMLKQNTKEKRMKMCIQPVFQSALSGEALYLPAHTLQYRIKGCPVPMLLPKLENLKQHYYVIQAPEDSTPQFELAPVPVLSDAEVFPVGERILQQTAVVRLELQKV